MFHYTYFILNAPLGSLFGIAPKTDEKTLARCKLNKLSFHNEGLPISPPTPGNYRGAHFGLFELIVSTLESVWSYIWRLYFAYHFFSIYLLFYH